MALIVGLLALATLAAATTVLLTRSQPQASRAAPARTYTFSPDRYPDGLQAVRRWTLTGPGGSVLKEVLTVSNPTAVVVATLLVEPIPAAIAPTLQAVRFTPSPYIILPAASAVEWKLRVPARGSMTISYRAQVPALGATSRRLVAWAAAVNLLEAGQSRTSVASRLRALSVSPRVIRIVPGQTYQLRLSGRLANGATAIAAMLAKATWRTGDAAVAIVSSSGKVTGKGAGTTRVTARIGSVRASMLVTVTGYAQPSPGTTYVPPTPAPGPTPTPNPTPTITGTPLARPRSPTAQPAA